MSNKNKYESGDLIEIPREYCLEDRYAVILTVSKNFIVIHAPGDYQGSERRGHIYDIPMSNIELVNPKVVSKEEVMKGLETRLDLTKKAISFFEPFL